MFDGKHELDEQAPREPESTDMQNEAVVYSTPRLATAMPWLDLQLDSCTII